MLNPQLFVRGFEVLPVHSPHNVTLYIPIPQKIVKVDQRLGRLLARSGWQILVPRMFPQVVGPTYDYYMRIVEGTFQVVFEEECPKPRFCKNINVMMLQKVIVVNVPLNVKEI